MNSARLFLEANFDDLGRLADVLGFDDRDIRFINEFIELVAPLRNISKPEDIDNAINPLLRWFPEDSRSEQVRKDSALIIRLASYVPSNHAGQGVLRKILLTLGEENPAWKDLEKFETELESQWQWTPLQRDDEEARDPKIFDPKQWQNLNAFAAKLFAATPHRFARLAVYTMRLALEESEPQDQGLCTKRVDAAYVWMHLAGGRFYKECLAKSHSTNATDGDPFGNGVLFRSNTTGFNMKRWEFWKVRWNVVTSYLRLGDMYYINPSITMSWHDGSRVRGESDFEL